MFYDNNLGYIDVIWNASHSFKQRLTDIYIGDFTHFQIYNRLMFSITCIQYVSYAYSIYRRNAGKEPFFFGVLKLRSHFSIGLVKKIMIF